MKRDDEVSACEGCGASVYKEHIQSGIARYEGGKLLCSHCLAEHDQSKVDAADEFEPIEFEDDEKEASTDMTSSRIHALDDTARGTGRKDETQFKRSLRPDGIGASRCRVFHCRISEGAVDFMANQINGWLEENDDITLKFATTTIGMFEGKHTEPNLITTVFY